MMYLDRIEYAQKTNAEKQNREKVEPGDRVTCKRS